jgi:uncharacterized membrane protein
MGGKKNTIVVVILITGFIFGVSFSTLYAQTHIVAGTACGCTLPIPILIPTFSSLGVFIGSIVYYLMFPKIEEKRTRIKEIKERYETNLETVLDMLEKNEKQVIEELMKNKGKVLQSKLSKQLGKVKAFRTVENLRKRDIVEKERYGKTNYVKFTNKFGLLLD